MQILSTRRAIFELMPTGGTIVEIGVFRGVSAWAIREIAKPKRLVLIDLFIDYQGVKGDDSFAYVQSMFANCFDVEIWRERSPAALAKLADRSVDVVHIDGGHTYAEVLADLEGIWPKMKPGGWIIGHDYCEICQFGVVRAVAVFCDRHRLELTALTDEKRIHWGASKGNQPPDMAFNSFAIQIA